jgi:zinc/manganese transport system substrate-binding protein
MKRLTLKSPALKWLGSTTLILLGLSRICQGAEPLPVLASFSILGDLVQVVGGERVKVTTLVGPNADAHAFAPRPADAKTLLHSKLMVVNGLHFEPWAEKLANSAGYTGETVVVSKGIKPRAQSPQAGRDAHDIDPHAWQNPENVIFYVQNIAAALAQADPSGATGYQTRAESYVKALQNLDAWAKAQFAAIPVNKRKVITSHDAFGYFAEHYQVRFLAPQGINTDAEPSARQVAQLIRQIQQEKIKAVFVENMSNPKLLDQLSRDAGITLGASLYSDALSSPDQPGATYLQMMRHNVTQLVAGMKLSQASDTMK